MVSLHKDRLRANTPQNQNANNTARSEQLHRASPHIILVQSKIDAAQAEIRGMERLASLEREPMSDTYRQHVRSFASDVQNDVNDARSHLDQLRSSVQNIQVSDSVRNDLQSADRALQQARTDLQRVDSIGHVAQPTPQPPQGQQAQANQPRQFTNYRDFGNAISGDLNNAKNAVGRIERALR
jgi:DNA repair exonuclease SbcCD ATPase subunit